MPPALSSRENTAVFGHIVADKLEAFCFTPLSFKVCSAVRLPQGLGGVPHHQHDAETYDRTDHSESKAIICMLGNRIHVLFLVAPNLTQRFEPNDRTREPNLAIAIAVFFVYLFKLDYQPQK